MSNRKSPFTVDAFFWLLVAISGVFLVGFIITVLATGA